MAEKFETWAILEIMGHQRFAGFVSEQTIGGASFVRVDVPQGDADHPAFTKLFGAPSIYAITPCTEEVARITARGLGRSPLSIYDLPEDIKDKLRQPAIAHVPSSDDDEELF